MMFKPLHQVNIEADCFIVSCHKVVHQNSTYAQLCTILLCGWLRSKVFSHPSCPCEWLKQTQLQIHRETMNVLQSYGYTYLAFHRQLQRQSITATPNVCMYVFSMQLEVLQLKVLCVCLDKCSFGTMKYYSWNCYMCVVAN